MCGARCKKDTAHETGTSEWETKNDNNNNNKRNKNRKRRGAPACANSAPDEKTVRKYAPEREEEPLCVCATRDRAVAVVLPTRPRAARAAAHANAKRSRALAATGSGIYERGAPAHRSSCATHGPAAIAKHARAGTNTLTFRMAGGGATSRG